MQLLEKIGTAFVHLFRLLERAEIAVSSKQLVCTFACENDSDPLLCCFGIKQVLWNGVHTEHWAERFKVLDYSRQDVKRHLG